MFPSLNKPPAPQPPACRQESHRADVKTQRARPFPNVRKYQEQQDQKPGTSKQNGPSGKKDKKKKDPLSIREVIRKYGKKLTELERKEILGYSEIWYLGLKAEKIKEHDDDKGHYIMVAHDHIAYRYEVLEVLGKGTFAQVFKCQDHKTNDMVAIKIMISAWKEYKTEVRILEALVQKGKDTSTNVIQMKEHFIFRNHFCITFELLGPDMLALLKKRQRQGFSKILVHRFACSLLKCLQVLHDEKIIHADLKPDNILVSSEEHFDIKVADFGISCYEDEQVYKYIGTRWYRPPEVLLQQPYNTAMDMWSLGCVLAEFYTGRPIFPGRNELDQLSCITEVLGFPPADMTEKSKVWSDFLAQKGAQKGEAKLRVHKFLKSRPLVGILGTTDYSFLDFIRRCLTWDPKKRMKPHEALQHKWIVEGGHLNPFSTHESKEPKETKKSLTSFRPRTHIKGEPKAICEEKHVRFQNMHSQNIPKKKTACKHPAQHLQ